MWMGGGWADLVDGLPAPLRNTVSMLSLASFTLFVRAVPTAFALGQRPLTAPTLPPSPPSVTSYHLSPKCAKARDRDRAMSERRGVRGVYRTNQGREEDGWRGKGTDEARV